MFDLLICAVCIGLMTAGPVAGLVADKASYSGKYSLQGGKKPSDARAESTIEVVQHEDSVEVTRVQQGSKTTTLYPLNGAEGNYKSPGGVAGKCKAELKGKYLVLEAFVVSRPQPTGPPVRMHTKERWQLSADSKTLTIKSEVDFPDFPGDVSAIPGGYGSGTEQYIRVENP